MIASSPDNRNSSHTRWARATYRKLTAADASSDHCHVGAGDVLNRAVMDWLEDVIAVPTKMVNEAAGLPARRDRIARLSR